MEKRKKLILILIACLTVVAVATACIFIFWSKTAAKNKILFEGIEDFHVPVGTMTDAQLLQNVTAANLQGENIPVSVDASGVDFAKPGKYSVTYMAGTTEKKASVYIYGPMAFQVGDITPEGDEVTVDFATAIGSVDFSKGVRVLDSFGNGVTVEKLDGSDDFGYEVGTYSVSYRATDRAGQVLEKHIVYNVTSDVNMTIEEGVSVDYAAKSVKFTVDLDGETDVWLMDGKTMVPSADYSVSSTTLTLYANYYRTLQPGENALKICSQNGAKDFVFTVVDTGTPIFSFDSLHTTKIMVGEATIFEKPQSLIGHHTYRYTYQFSGEAKEAGDSVAFKTYSGKNLGAGTYSVTVTAANADQPDKKTTKTFKFRIYSNQAEMEGVELAVDLKGAALNLKDLTDYGYPTGYDFQAKTQNSWDSRLIVKDLEKQVFSTISFDIYIYSCGIASKENGSLNYNSGTANIPFTAMDNKGNSYGIACFDRTGTLVETKDLKLNTWYTMRIDVSELALDKTNISIHAGVNNTRKISMYIASVNAYAYQYPEAIVEFKSDDGSMSISRNGHKSSLVKTQYNGENVLRYSVNAKHVPQTDLQRALKLKLKDSRKNVIRMDFMYESGKMASGADAVTRMYVSDKLNENGRFGADYLVTDENGNPITVLETGKWYTLWVTANGDQEFTLYPLGAGSSPIYADLLIKNFTALKAPATGNKIVTADGNNSNVSLYTYGEEWLYGYASDTTIHKTNTAYSRRLMVKLDAKDYKNLSFRFMLNASAVGEGAKTGFSVFAPLNLQIKNESGIFVNAGALQTGVWYTATVTNAGNALPENLELYPMGFTDPSETNPVLITMQIKDLQASKEDKVETELVVDAKGATLTPVDLTELGYDVGYDFQQKTQNSWDGRLVFKGLRKEMYSSISFDFYVYSCGIASEENGELDYTHGTANIPFAAMDNAGNGYGIVYFDKDGNLVEAKDLKQNTWYTMKIDVSALVKDSDLSLHAGISNKHKISMYITNIVMETYQKPEAIVEFQSEDGSMSISRNGDKSSMEKTEHNGEDVLRYTVDSRHIPQTDLQRALKLKLNDGSKNVIRMDFMYESAKMAAGTSAITRMHVSDLMNQNGRFGADYIVTDENGDPVTVLDLDKWYTLWITTYDDTEFTLYPLGQGESPIFADLLLKNYTAVEAPVGSAQMVVADGNNTNVSLYQKDDVWQYGYASDTTIHKTNTAYNRRLVIKLDGENYEKLSFRFMLNASTVGDMFKTGFSAFAPITLQIKNANGIVVNAGALQTGVWYTATVTSTNGVLPNSFELYPLGFTDPSAEAPVAVRMQMKDLLMGEPEAPEPPEKPVYENADQTASIEPAGTGVTMTKNGNIITYAADSTVSADNRRIDIKLLDSSKDVIRMGFKLISATEPNVYVSDLANSSGIFGANYVITDANGKLVSTLKIGKDYTLWITTEGQSKFTLYPMKFVSGAVAMELTMPETFDVADALSGMTLVPNSGNHACLGLYQVGGTWQYGYVSDVAIHSGNTADMRHIKVKMTETVKEASFQLMLEESIYEGAIKTGWNISGASAKFTDSNGAEVAANALQTGVWYTVTFTNSGNDLPATIICYPMGWSTQAGVKIKMQIKNLQVGEVEEPEIPTEPEEPTEPEKPTEPEAPTEPEEPPYINADQTASIEPYSTKVTFTKAGNKIIYAADSTISAENRRIKLKIMDTTKEVVKMDVKLVSATNPVLFVSDLTNSNGIYGADYLFTDADGKLVSTLEIGKDYTLWIATEGQSEFTLYPMKYASGAVALELTIPESFDVELDDAKFAAPGGNNATVGWYQKDGQWLQGYVSDVAIQPSNNAYNRRLELKLDSTEYKTVSFMFYLEESTVADAPKGKFAGEGLVLEIYKDGTKITDNYALETGVWYTVFVKKSGGANLPATLTLYPLGYENSGVDVRMIMKNITLYSDSVTYTRNTLTSYIVRLFRRRQNISELLR